jgi:hypothetical protein
MFDMYRPEQLNTSGIRHHSEWSMWHFLPKEKTNPENVEFMKGHCYRRALAYGLRPEFAWEFANQ